MPRAASTHAERPSASTNEAPLDINYTAPLQSETTFPTAVADVEPLLQNITALTPLAVALVTLAGLIVGVAPSSFPLLSVAAGLAAGRGATDPGQRRVEGLWLSAGFALGIATVDGVLGTLFGLAGFAVLRVLANFLAIAYAVLGLILAATGFALLRVIRVRIPVLMPSPRPTRSFAGSCLLGLPFGLSTCPACTPLLLPELQLPPPRPTRSWARR
jgi:cytochrome c-type biogenesis protein